MISNDCFGNLVPNYRFPAGKIYERQIQQKNRSSINHRELDASNISIKNFENIEKASFVYKVSEKEVDFQDIEPLRTEHLVSEVLANQTLIGLQAIGSSGPIICSGPFANNKKFLKTIEKNWADLVIVEDDHLGICKGIANLINRKRLI